MKRVLAILGVSSGLLCGGSLFGQVSIDQAYLFSTSSQIPNGSPAFTLNATDGVVLTLDGVTGIATAQSDFSGPLQLPVQFAFTYGSHSGSIDNGETGVVDGAHVNPEIGTASDTIFVEEGVTDAPENADFGAAAVLTFAALPAGITHIVIAEDAGLDAFKLEADTGSGFVTLFDGFNDATRDGILSRSDFGTSDTQSDGIDQFYVFIFDAALPAVTFRMTQTVDLLESGQDSGTLLELDFIGATIPEPASSLLVGLALAAVSLGLRRRR